MPSSPPPSDATDRLGEALEAAGCRCTRQRRAVFGYLCRAGHHPTAEEIFRAVQGELPRISLATIYKALEALEACGLVRRLLSPGDGSTRFDARSEPHYHLRCLRSGRVDDVPTEYDPDLVTKLDPDLAGRLRDRGFRVTGYRLELVGYFDGEPSGGGGD